MTSLHGHGTLGTEETMHTQLLPTQTRHWPRRAASPCSQPPLQLPSTPPPPPGQFPPSMSSNNPPLLTLLPGRTHPPKTSKFETFSRNIANPSLSFDFGTFVLPFLTLIPPNFLPPPTALSLSSALFPSTWWSCLVDRLTRDSHALNVSVKARNVGYVQRDLSPSLTFQKNSPPLSPPFNFLPPPPP